MLPVVALVGRPNVGKSTLFNVLTRTRDALVADLPGLTRDRHYGICHLGEREFVVVDTGGLTDEKEGIGALTARQANSRSTRPIWWCLSSTRAMVCCRTTATCSPRCAVRTSRSCWSSTRSTASTKTPRWRSLPHSVLPIRC